MKCITIRPTKRRNPEFSKADLQKAKKNRLPYRVKPTIVQPSGTVIEHREAWMLVDMGVALPADEECQKTADMSEDKLVRAIAYQELLGQGRTTGIPDSDGQRQESSVQLPAEWSHLTDRINEEIEKRQTRIDELHSESKREAAEEKAEGQVMYFVDAADLPPDLDELPDED